MRTRVQAQVSLSTTTAEERDHGNIAVDLIDDTLLEGGTTRVKLPVSTTNLAVTLPGIAAASFLVIRTESVDPTQTPAAIQVRLNATDASVITVAPMGLARKGFLALTTSGVTAVYLTNPSSTVPMFVTVGAAGDP